jgi:hypothetical protein
MPYMLGFCCPNKITLCMGGLGAWRAGSIGMRGLVMGGLRLGSGLRGLVRRCLGRCEERAG